MTTSYSCILFNLPDAIANSIKEWSIKNIPDEKIWTPANKENHNKYVGGRKFDSHITVKYGLHTKDVKVINELFEKNKSNVHVPFSVSFTDIEKFTPTGEYDVIVIKVESSELHNINKIICDNLEYTDSFKYDPHVSHSLCEKR